MRVPVNMREDGVPGWLSAGSRLHAGRGARLRFSLALFLCSSSLLPTPAYARTLSKKQIHTYNRRQKIELKVEPGSISTLKW